MKTSLPTETTAGLLAALDALDAGFFRAFPGEPTGRQPVHVVYGGAHRFTADTVPKLGKLAREALKAYAPDFPSFARAVGLHGHDTLPAGAWEIAAEETRLATGAGQGTPAWRAWTIYRRVEEKLVREPVEDFRLDYEDGYGLRSDAEEDEHAVVGARALAQGLAAGTLSPFIGFRIKSLAPETRKRALRTLDLFLTALVESTGGRLPPNFVVTLPKVQHVGHVEALEAALSALEPRLGLEPGALKLELMVELTQTLVGASGELVLPRLVQAAKGRCVSAHFGTYDYTASAGITANQQRMQHPACNFARHLMQVGLARSGVFLSDGATTELPLPPHKGAELTPKQKEDNRTAVHAAWRAMAANVRDSLARGYFQGWDLHPAQLPVRYAVTYEFFLEAQADAATRLKNFVDKAAKATTVGTTFDDAATGQGLLNFFLRAVACGAMSEEEVVSRTGVTLEALHRRSFGALVG